MWFSQHYLDPEDPASGFDATFTKGSTTVTPTALLPHGNDDITEVDTSSDNIIGSQGVHGTLTPPFVSLGRTIASKGDLLHPDMHNTDSGGDLSRPRDYKNSRVKVRFKDSVTSTPIFTNVNESSLRRPKRLHQRKLTYDGDDIVYNIFTNFSANSPMLLAAPESLFERTLCAQEKSSTLIENAIN